MIDKNVVGALVAQWLEGKDYFLTDLSVSADDRIVVEIDHRDGVWIEDCVALSRHIEQGLDRDEEDFELEVGSAGIGQPFKVRRQYEIHIDDPVEVVLTGGQKKQGVLLSVSEEGVVLSVREKVKPEGAKRPKLVDVECPVAFSEIKEARYWLDFK
ncbi:MAG: ribosome assembly cofactor RimP [Alloprevotella sp.]|nr:ribosome assembly cofactor RimP [Alloprevotella sp.]